MVLKYLDVIIEYKYDDFAKEVDLGGKNEGIEVSGRFKRDLPISPKFLHLRIGWANIKGEEPCPKVTY